ncbi:hypothetical protein ABK040_004746 [Willaertia magna]
MSQTVNTPVNQIRHTNIAIVRIKIQKAIFEIACYKNKVLGYRKGIEDDLDEVLQIDTVFTNVSKGEAAKKSDLQKYFGTTNQKEVCKKILLEGELQISPKEREVMFETMFKDIVTIIINKCINPDTQRPYPMGLIERTLKEEIHLTVKLNKSAKQQALEAIRKLKKKIPIERAQMRLKCTFINREEAKRFKQFIKGLNKEEEQVVIEKEDVNVNDQDLEGNSMAFTILIDPGVYRDVYEHVTGVQGELKLIDTAVSEEGEQSIDELKGEHEKKQFTKEHSDNEEGLEEEKVDQKKEEEEVSKKKKKKEKKKKIKEENEPVITKVEEKEDDDDDFGKKKKKDKKKKKQNKEKEIHSEEETKKNQKEEVITLHEEDEEEEEEKPKETKKKGGKNTKKNNKKDKQNVDSEEEDQKQPNKLLLIPKDEDEDEEEENIPQQPMTATQKKKLKRLKKLQQKQKQEEHEEEEIDE